MKLMSILVQYFGWPNPPFSVTSLVFSSPSLHPKRTGLTSRNIVLNLHYLHVAAVPASCLASKTKNFPLKQTDKITCLIRRTPAELLSTVACLLNLRLVARICWYARSSTFLATNKCNNVGFNILLHLETAVASPPSMLK